MSLPAILQLLDRIADRCGLLHQPLRPERLIARAARRAGSSDFGDIPFHEPLARLLGACASESAPSLVGRIATRWDVLRFLGNLLRLAEEDARDPAIRAEPIARPIFITGLPRSGTSFLHRLLLQDPDNFAPLVWQTIAPYPPAAGPDRRVAEVEAQLRMFARCAPEFPGLHPLSATSPQECSEIGAHVFRSLRFDTTYRVPSYRRWLDHAGLLPAYRFERRFLQHLQHQRRLADPSAGPGRWVLKCPDHVFALDDLRAAFPDARIVFVHRDPIKVLVSVAKLTEVLRRPFSRAVDPVAIGRGEAERWLLGTERMQAAAAADGFATPICHVHHTELVRDPVGAVRRLYRHFDLSLEPGAAASMGRLVTLQPRGGYAHDAYRFADHGLDPDTEREKFRPYMEYFGVRPESATPAPVRGGLSAAA
ncbi:MAG: sulfotransferase [Rhodospirillales bacterium]|nr:sulfotransferase [Rhodospirillales bacterium]